MCIEWVKRLALSGLAGTQGGSLPTVGVGGKNTLSAAGSLCVQTVPARNEKEKFCAACFY